MKSLQKNLTYYQNQKQQIINNKGSYQSTRMVNEYGPWQSASYTFLGHDILAKYQLSWWYGVFWKKGRVGQHMKSDVVTQASIRQEIALKLGRPLDEISTNLNISARGEDPTYDTLYGDVVIFNTYTVGYQHRKLEQKQETYFDQAKYDQALVANEKQIEQAQAAIYNKLKSVDNLQRTLFLAELSGQPDAASTVELIKQLGFDANKLAEIAVSNNNISLFDLALQYKANCGSYFINGEALLERIIKEGKESFLQKVLSKNQDLTVLLLNSISKNDILVVDKLLSLKPQLLKQKYDGFTLLQKAIIAKGSSALIQKILSLDSKLVETLSDNSETALKIAIARGDKDIINLITEHANIEIELAQIGSKLRPEAKAHIIASKDFEALIALHSKSLFLPTEASGEKYVNGNNTRNIDVKVLGSDKLPKDDSEGEC